MNDFSDCKLGETKRGLDLNDRLSLCSATDAMLSQARKQVQILSWNLEPWLYDRQELVEILRDRVTREQYLKVRILVHDPRAVSLRGHRLLELARQLRSYVTLRRPNTAGQEPVVEGFLVADGTGYIHRPLFDRHEGRANFYDPGRANTLLQHFEELWQHGADDTELRSMLL